MNIFKSYNKRILKHDVINKFNIDKDLPQLKKVILNFGCKNNSIQKVTTTMLALNIIAGKRSKITKSTKSSILLKVQKGQPSGCKIELKNNNEIYYFINKLHFKILPKLNNFSKFEATTSNLGYNFCCQIPGNQLKLEELENQHPLFSNLPILDINIFTNTKNSKKKLFLMKSMKITVST